MTGDVRGSWLVVGALVLVAAGCGEASSDVAATAPPGPVASPTAVPGAPGRVVSTQRVNVSDDGSGPRMCESGIWDLVGPVECTAFEVAGWDWDAVDGFEDQEGVRWGSYVVSGTFDGSTFTVEEATQPDPEPYEWDIEIPCPTPEGGWQVLDAARTTDAARGELGARAEKLPGYALWSVSTPEGEPGPRTASDTVVTVYTAGNVAATEAALREVWGGMLCVAHVEHSYSELKRIQRDLLDVPGMSEVGSGNPDNQVELTVFNDDGSIQRWADLEYGEGVVVVHSILQPVG